jgi:citrate synthase
LTPEFLAESVSFLNLGVLGVVFLLFVAGKLHSQTEYEQLLRDLETERTAHERTREALRIANARSESGALAAEIVARALEGVHKAGGDPTHAPAVES